VNILYFVPVAKRYRAMEHETRLAADHGHEVHLLADFRPYWETHEIDPRVTVHWLRSREVKAPQSAPATWLLCRIPRAVLRRLARGPLNRPVGKVLYEWNRRIANPIEQRRKRRTAELRHEYRRGALMSVMERHRIDWLVLGEPGAVDLIADDLPALFERRPELRTTYSYEEFADAR
jgi:hypothetical protein